MPATRIADLYATVKYHHQHQICHFRHARISPHNLSMVMLWIYEFCEKPKATHLNEFHDWFFHRSPMTMPLRALLFLQCKVPVKKYSWKMYHYGRPILPIIIHLLRQQKWEVHYVLIYAVDMGTVLMQRVYAMLITQPLIAQSKRTKAQQFKR